MSVSSRLALALVFALALAGLSACAQESADAPTEPSVPQESSQSNDTDEPAQSSAGDQSAKEEASGDVADSSESAETQEEFQVPADALVTVEQLYGLIEDGKDPFALDIRTRKQHAEFFIVRSHNIPMGKQMEARLAEIPTDEDIYIISSGDRGCAETYEALVGFGYDSSRLFVVQGGMNEWLKADYPVKKEPILSC